MIHIYSGEGKGKTTAAIGLAIRASGAGLRVHFYQFMKNGNSSEVSVLRKTDDIIVCCCKECNKFSFKMNKMEKELVKKAHNRMLLEIEQTIDAGLSDMIIMDEIFSACNCGLADIETALRIVKMCSEKASTELVLTGHSPHEDFIKYADYHSIIEAARHPYDKGIKARKGIEY